MKKIIIIILMLVIPSISFGFDNPFLTSDPDLTKKVKSNIRYKIAKAIKKSEVKIFETSQLALVSTKLINVNSVEIIKKTDDGKFKFVATMDLQCVKNGQVIEKVLDKTFTGRAIQVKDYAVINTADTFTQYPCISFNTGCLQGDCVNGIGVNIVNGKMEIGGFKNSKLVSGYITSCEDGICKKNDKRINEKTEEFYITQQMIEYLRGILTEDEFLIISIISAETMSKR